MICGICSERATHYYRTAGGDNAGRCQFHADQFGYPEYLIELTPAPVAIRQPGYLIQFWDGNGEDQDAVAAVWPFEAELAEWWVQNITACRKEQADWAVADAAYAPYEPQFLDGPSDVTCEITRVTVLSLV